MTPNPTNFSTLIISRSSYYPQNNEVYFFVVSLFAQALSYRSLGKDGAKENGELSL